MLFRAFSRGGLARREPFQHESAARPSGARSPDAPVRRVAAVALTDVRLGSLGLALARQGRFAEWMGKGEL